MAVLVLGLTACGDDENDEPNSSLNQHIQVDGQNWDLSKAHPPVFNGHLGVGDDSGLIFTKITKKVDPDKWYEYFDRSDVSIIQLDISGPEIKLGVNLLNDPNIWSIWVTYTHGTAIDYDNPPDDFFIADYRYLNPSKFGKTTTDYSGSIIVKEFTKDKSMTIEFNNFCLMNYLSDSWGPKLHEHKKIVLNGTVKYEYDEVTW